MEVLNVLFCDNDDKRHKRFDDVVLPFLREQLPDCEIRPLYSQSLEPEFDHLYDRTLWDKGARSVSALLDEGVRPDLVITDMDFFSSPMMGNSHTGFDIIETIAKRTSAECPWLRFIVITAQLEEADKGRLMDVAQYYLGGQERAKESLISLSKDAPEANWQAIQIRAGALALKILRQRGEFKEWMAGLVAPDLYQVVILRKDLSDEGMRVIVRERGEGGNALGFRLGAQGVTFAALAENPRRFTTEGRLVRSATKRKAAGLGEMVVRLSPEHQRRILGYAGIESKSNREFCRFDDRNDLCAVADGRSVAQGQVGYQCQTKLDGLCVKKLLTRAIDDRGAKVSADSVRRHLNEIRAEVNDARKPLIGGWLRRYEEGGRFHSGDHHSGVLCGSCLIYRRRDSAGYALAGSVRWIDCDDERDLLRRFEGLLADPEEIENEDAS